MTTTLKPITNDYFIHNIRDKFHIQTAVDYVTYFHKDAVTVCDKDVCDYTFFNEINNIPSIKQQWIDTIKQQFISTLTIRNIAICQDENKNNVIVLAYTYRTIINHNDSDGWKLYAIPCNEQNKSLFELIHQTIQIFYDALCLQAEDSFSKGRLLISVLNSLSALLKALWLMCKGEDAVEHEDNKAV